ncbi:PREDICTED: transcription initiation factor TFIID subunit 4-like [Priapulus caudatus]|uniref:Transcription initiation factor TFIID subunit 4-like n=1 Tax=Priapulus caudatus TaxID=37621 RepID=A0ABM1ET05_PRICU|nr:PREDICTED: transcription initiation factor TFIID subunit 4-like [Priapulus caudatus]
MASSKSLEDVLSSEVDESAVNALVGTLESQLSSSSVTSCSQQVSANVILNNHISGNVIGSGSLTLGTGGQKNMIINLPNNNSQADGSTTSSSAATNKSIPQNVQGTGINSLGTALNCTQQMAGVPASGYLTLSTTCAQINSARSSPSVTIAPSPLPTVGVQNAMQQNIIAKNGTISVVQNANGTMSLVTQSSSDTVNGTVNSGLSAIQSLASVAAHQAKIVTMPGQATVRTVHSPNLITTNLPQQRIVIRQDGQPSVVKADTTNSANVVQMSTATTSLMKSVQNSLSTGSVINVSAVSSQPAGQQLVYTSTASGSISNPASVLQGVQLVNMNVMPRPGMSNQQKPLAPRVILNTGTPIRIASPAGVQVQRPNMVQVSGQSMDLRPSLLQGSVLVRTPSGQLQLVTANLPTALQPRSSATNPPSTAYRLQTIQHPVQTQVTTSPVRMSVPAAGMHTVSMASSSPLVSGTASSSHGPSATVSAKMSPEVAKKKCKNFFSTLIKLASSQPPDVAANVRKLIQGVIDGLVQPEDFTTKLEAELKSSPQPFLVPFLKRSLPHLRQSLYNNEVSIEGVNPPPPSALAIPAVETTPLPAPTVHNKVTRPGQVTSQQAIAQQHMLNSQHKNVSQVMTKLVPGSIAASTPTIAGALKPRPGIHVRAGASAPQREKGHSAFRDDDDINDVAAMGGVNLIEESQRILASTTEHVGTVERSCKDESFLLGSALQTRIREIVRKHGLDDAPADVANLVSHATQERLRTIIEKLGLIAEHRIDTVKMDTHYKESTNVRTQLKFLEELDKLEKKRHEEQEREMLLRLAKSRSKQEDPEQARLKQKAKEMQQAEMEVLRQQEANQTALAAIGPRKRRKFDQAEVSDSAGTSGTTPAGSAPQRFQRPRTKRVNLRDLIFLMEQERETCRSVLLYKSFLK